MKLPLAERRPALEQFVADNVGKSAAIRLSPATTTMVRVKNWFRSVGGGLDGVIAKKLVVEVQYDHFSGGRFRNGASFLRWRPDEPLHSVWDTVGGVREAGR